MSVEHTSDQYLLQTADNALAVLDLLSETPPLTLTEIAERMGRGKTITLRLVYTLEKRGYLIRGKDNRYTLGMRLFTLGNKVRSRREYLLEIQPLMDELTAAVSETSHLVTWENYHNVILLYESLPANQTLRTESSTGVSSRRPHMTSTGIAMLATLSDREIDAYANSVFFEKRTEYSIGSEEQLLQDIAQVRNSGFSINNQRFERGKTSIAVAIPDRDGHSEFAISVSGPSPRLEEKMSLILSELRKTADKIRPILYEE